MVIFHVTVKSVKCRIYSLPYLSSSNGNEFLKVHFCTDGKTKTETNNLKLPKKPKHGCLKVNDFKLPMEPQHCCMSGCANCVWVKYAEELSTILNDGGEMARQKIIENVKDPNLRTFVMLELGHLLKKDK